MNKCIYRWLDWLHGKLDESGYTLGECELIRRQEFEGLEDRVRGLEVDLIAWEKALGDKFDVAIVGGCVRKLP